MALIFMKNNFFLELIRNKILLDTLTKRSYHLPTNILLILIFIDHIYMEWKEKLKLEKPNEEKRKKYLHKSGKNKLYTLLR